MMSPPRSTALLLPVPELDRPGAVQRHLQPGASVPPVPGPHRPQAVPQEGFQHTTIPPVKWPNPPGSMPQQARPSVPGPPVKWSQPVGMVQRALEPRAPIPPVAWAPTSRSVPPQRAAQPQRPPASLPPMRMPHASGTVQPMRRTGPEMGQEVYQAMQRTKEGQVLCAAANKACIAGYGISFSERPTQTLGTHINICIASGSRTDLLYDIVQELWNVAKRAQFRGYREHPPEYEGRPDGLQHAVNLELLERGAARIYQAIAVQLQYEVSAFVQETSHLSPMDYMLYMAEYNREHVVKYAQEVDPQFEQTIAQWSRGDK